MISIDNKPINRSASNENFTVNAYIELLEQVKNKFKTILYADCFVTDSFILWRHDVDFSLNHALALARIEHQLGISATYFINIHSDFYNALAPDETEIIQTIKELGHDIGIHLDANYHDVKDTAALERALEVEILIFEKMFNSVPRAFSFHNPKATHLVYDKRYYAGLINCYSAYFKQDVDYVSDSNGYWRFKSIQDCLGNNEVKKLQVLTHPGWWQECVSYPRERVCNIVFRRAADTVRKYDRQLELDNRENLTRVPQNLMNIFKRSLPISAPVDVLFNQKMYDQIYTIFLDVIQSQDRQKILTLNAQMTDGEGKNYDEDFLKIFDFDNKVSKLEIFKNLSDEKKIDFIDKMSFIYGQLL